MSEGVKNEGRGDTDRHVDTRQRITQWKKKSHNFQTNIQYRLGASIAAALTSAN